jgi:hypothetical protein
VDKWRVAPRRWLDDDDARRAAGARARKTTNRTPGIALYEDSNGS